MVEGRFRVMTVVLALVSTTAVEVWAQPVPSCSKTLGQARADRLVRQCSSTTTATHSPCNALNDCETISEHITLMCRQNAGDEPPAFCGESLGLSKLSDLGIAERYAKTVAAEEKHGGRLRDRMRQTRSKLEPLAAKVKEAAQTLKKSRADFDSELTQVKRSYDMYKGAAKKPGSLPETVIRDLLGRLEAVVKHGESLAQQAAAISASETQLSTLNNDASIARLTLRDELSDMKQAKTLIDAAATKLSQDAKKKPELAAEVTKLKALSTQAAASVKASAMLDAEAGKEADALKTLAQATPAGAQARSQAFQAAKKTERDRAKAEDWRRDVAQALPQASSSSVATTSSAKGSACDLEHVDFRNFSYAWPDNPKATPTVFKNGTEGGSTEEWANKVSNVKFWDLDGAGKKEAVVFIEGPPSAHSGPQNELIFVQSDDQCRIQVLKRLSGGVTDGSMNGKSYFYGDTLLSSVDGMGGLFATGTETVELRYINGKLKEVSRKADQ